MGVDEISKKMREVLQKSELTEADVVFMLSKVRKIIEIDKKNNSSKDYYAVLIFYCNLALHSEISRPLPKEIKSMFMDMKNGNTANSMLYFANFHTGFQKFIRDKDLPDDIYRREHGIRDLNRLLIGIYSDTPITLTLSENYEIRINKTSIDDMMLFSMCKKEQDN